MREVLASAGAGEAVLVKVADLDAGANTLQRAGLEVERRATDLRVAIAPAEAERVSRTLADAGQWVIDMRPEERSLEDLFLELTGSVDAAPAPTLEEVGA